MEKRVGQEYIVHQIPEQLVVEPLQDQGPVDMKPRVEYTPVQRFRRMVDQRIGEQFRRGRRG